MSLPAILEKVQRGWMFDPVAGPAAVRERRIGANEANAIRTLGTFTRALEKFRLRDMDGVGTLRYARRVHSAAGESDGLVGGASDVVPGLVTSFLNELSPGRRLSRVTRWGNRGLRL